MFKSNIIWLLSTSCEGNKYRRYNKKIEFGNKIPNVLGANKFQKLDGNFSEMSDSFIDDFYRNMSVNEITTTTAGISSVQKNEFTYDENGNIISMKTFQNGQLSMEWKDYVWGDKKNTHVEIMYMNGSPMSTTEVTQL